MFVCAFGVLEGGEGGDLPDIAYVPICTTLCEALGGGRKAAGVLSLNTTSKAGSHFLVCRA